MSRNPKTGEEQEDDLGNERHGFRYLEENENWKVSSKTDAGYWCLPYYDSLYNREVVVSYSVPLHDAVGRMYGVLCADVGLGWVKRMVEEAKPFAYSTVTVLSRDSQYVCHPNEALVQTMNAVKQARLTHNDSYLRLTQRMLRGEKGIDTLDQTLEYLNSEETADGSSKAVVFYAPVEGVNWSVCFTIPEDKIMERPNRLRIMMITVPFLLFARKHNVRGIQQQLCCLASRKRCLGLKLLCLGISEQTHRPRNGYISGISLGYILFILV